ncbi:hypothetical protein Tco_0552274 [Tanacetum coccineum]
MRCSTDESRCYGYTLDGQRRSRDVVVVYEMFNGGVEMLSSRDVVVVYEMFNEGVEMISLYIRCSRDALQEKVEQSTTMSATSDEILSTEESICYRYTLDVQRMSRDAIVVHETFNGFVEMISLYIKCLTDESRCYRCDLYNF